jgi:hypothetical protein
MLSKVIPSHSIKAFRYRVHVLEKDLWKEQNPLCRANLAMQLADVATTLARLEMQEARRYQLLDSPDSAHPGAKDRAHGKVDRRVERDDVRGMDQALDRRGDRREDGDES